MLKRKKVNRLIAWVLMLTMIISTFPVYAQNNKNRQNTDETTSDITNKNELSSEKYSYLYEDGYIKIYTLQQLNAIGSDKVLTSKDNSNNGFGKGKEVICGEKKIVYSLDAKYMLMNDILLDNENMWTMPEYFTGSFTSAKARQNEQVYSDLTDTVYIYNNYQLKTVCSPNANNEPIMTGDRFASDFGMGQLVYKNGKPEDNSAEASQNYLKYDKQHKYVLASTFTSAMPNLKSNQFIKANSADDQKGGRVHVGQVHTKVDGKDYILIGNEQQLREIGKNTQVAPMLFLRTKFKILGIPVSDKLIPYYPGDADFNVRNIDQTGIKYKDIEDKTKSFQYLDQNPTPTKLMNPDWGNPKGLLDAVVGVVGGLLGGVVDLLFGGQEIVGLKNEGTVDVSIGSTNHVFGDKEYKNFDELKNEYKNLKYTSDANYIIFRDIDLASGEFSNGQDDNWTPINISGNMEGRRGMQDGAAVNISNVHVEQNGELDPSTTRGIGFFGSISNQIDENDFGHSKGTTIVEDIQLNNVTVINNSTKVKPVDMNLVKILLGTIGGLLGGLVDVVGNLLDFLLGWAIPGLGNLNLGDVIRDLLTVQQNSPDIFATGSFAGRVTGDVKIQNCKVINAEVSSVKDMSGGFVGYTEGAEKYDGLSKILSGAVKMLSKLLNILPGVGLGDLITVLLKNAIDLGELIPVGYYKPTIENCIVSLTNGKIGQPNTNYNGGFVGMQTASNIKNCQVNALNSVNAMKGAGGFAGIARDAVIHSLLTDLGVDLLTFDIKSNQESCIVNGQILAIVAKEMYAGGFNGVMTNSVSMNCEVNGLSSVETVKYAGGFTGRATIGYGTTIGDGDEKNNTLLESVTKLLTDLIAPGNDDKLNTLLAISGLTPSELHECRVFGTNLNVTATNDYAGGLLGQGDGVEISLLQREKPSIAGKPAVPEKLDVNPVIISDLKSVSANNYAGGIAGSVVTANPIGVLNTTLGVGSYLPFRAAKINLNGTNLNVKANEKYASGGFGLMLGGKVQQVNINGLDTVEAQNYTGGLAGRAGTGSLVREGGLDLLGMGLVKVDNVLSLAQGVNVKIEDTHVIGSATGAVIHSVGVSGLSSKESVLAAGLISEAEGIQVKNTDVTQIKEIKAEKGTGQDSYAGGFIGRSHTGGLVGIAQKEDGGKLTLPGIVDISSLLNLVPYLVPEYYNCETTFVSNGDIPQIAADYAGGFFGYIQSGKVNNDKSAPYVVYGIENIKGTDYAGGFAGKIEAGAVATSDGLKLLGGIINLDLNNLLSVLNVYIPKIDYAGVKSTENGLVVEATANKSSAGGYVGTASGATIKNSCVDALKHTKVNAPKDLETMDGSTYFDSSSQYAVKAGRYAGGFAGRADIDSAAQVGEGLKVANLLDLNNLLSALDVVSTNIENCDVKGCIGGFSVLANGTNNLGKAGGFVGEGSGCQIKNSNVQNFAYIIGHEMAGGYAGNLEPGNVAAVLGNDQTILNGLLDINNTLASLVSAFIPVVEDSKTVGIPCGGAIRADGLTDPMNTRGLAGGYVGYNHGGRIKGVKTECSVIRLRSVYGSEFAGGFTGLMENADLVGTGNLKLLFGLVETSNVLSLLGAVYPTETNTATYGPLRQLAIDEWNAWVDAVGKNGVYGYQFPIDKVGSQEELDALISKYAYGYNVKAGRTSVGSQMMQSGTAGGYVGTMNGGVVTEAHARDVMNVSAYTAAGAFAGNMITSGVAEIGKVSLIGLDLTGSISAVQTFVPVIRNCDATGYQSGVTVSATGVPVDGSNDRIEKVGYAGGFVGHMLGGQIWGNWKDPSNSSLNENNRCYVDNLRRVNGTNAVGGFAGLIEPGSAAALDTAGSSGLLGGLLQKIIGTPGDLLSVLNATYSTVKACDVKSWDDYGIVINGLYSNGKANTNFANTAGGFAGEIRGTVVGTKDNSQDGIHVYNMRSVTGGEHVGGFFGLADVSAVAEISGGGETSILGSLLKLGSLDALDAFRTYIYDSDVSGTEKSGLEINARYAKKLGYVNEPVYTGNAGGFGGTLLDGSVKNCKVLNLRMVDGLNYTGGFIGHLGKSGVVDVDNLGIFDKFANIGAGVLDVFGSHVDNSEVSGIQSGFTVKSKNTLNSKDKSQISGGFAGFADLSRMSNNKVTNLNQVLSEEIAGGFVGETTFAYLAEIKLDSPVVNLLVDLLNRLLKALWIQDLENAHLIKIDLGIIKVDALWDGNLIHVNLLGLDIKIALAKDKQLATIYIGDSKVEVNCANDGSFQDENLKNEIRISLIKANRTKIDGCSVTGIKDGYDVYGGGAGNDANGTGTNGYAGGFVGLNHEGLMKNNQMVLADVIRGAVDCTGPFVGYTDLDSVYSFNTVSSIEGENNQFRIYRTLNNNYSDILGNTGQILQTGFETDANWNIYTMTHMQQSKTEKFKDFANAQMHSSTDSVPLNVYMENGAMAVLMNNTPSVSVEPGMEEPGNDIQDPCTDIVQLRIKKIWKNDTQENRPSQIRLLITRSYTVDGNVVQDDSFREEIIVSKNDYLSQNVWEKVVTGNQYTAYRVAGDGTKLYYTYYVSEDAIDGYKTEIKYGDKEHHYNVTIINERNPFNGILPEVGGFGTAPFYVLGTLLISILVFTEYKRKRKDRETI